MPGDANRDSKVDVGDLGILPVNYGLTAGATWAQGDFNKDGQVDVSDLGILAAHYCTGSGGVRDFHHDAAALGLPVESDEAKTSIEETLVPSTLGCFPAGFGLIAGLLWQEIFL